MPLQFLCAWTASQILVLTADLYLIMSWRAEMETAGSIRPVTDLLLTFPVNFALQ